MLTYKDRSLLRAKGSDPTPRKANKPLDMQFDPQETSLDKPKHGQEDSSGVAHAGGNTFAGGVRISCFSSSHSLIQLKTGGRDTAGSVEGVTSAFTRMVMTFISLSWVGHGPALIKFASQISNMLQEDVPESVRLQARLIAQQELEARLAELNMTSADADSYGARLTAVQAHIAQLRNLL